MAEQNNAKKNEVQSKTVILGEVDGIDDLLSDLNKGRGQLTRKEEKSIFTPKNILIGILLLIVLAEIIYLFVR